MPSSERCFLCDGQAAVGAPAAKDGGIIAASLVECPGCPCSYLLPQRTDVAKLKALSRAQKDWLAEEARRSLSESSQVFVINEGAILMARSRAK